MLKPSTVVLNVVADEYGSTPDKWKKLARDAGNSSPSAAKKWLAKKNAISLDALVPLMGRCERLRDEVWKMVEEEQRIAKQEQATGRNR